MLQRWRYSAVAAYIPDQCDILDIGGYDGSFLLKVRDRIRRGVCIDPLIEERRRDGLEFIRCRIEGKLPFADASFDVVTMLAVYEHMNEFREEITSETYRILKEGGCAVLTVPSKAVDHILKALIAVRVLDGMSAEEHECFESRDTVGIFQGCGFRLERWERFQFGLNNLFVFRKIG